MIKIYSKDYTNIKYIEEVSRFKYGRRVKNIRYNDISKHDFKLLKNSEDYNGPQSIDEYRNQEEGVISAVAENSSIYNFDEDKLKVLLNRTVKPNLPFVNFILGIFHILYANYLFYLPVVAIFGLLYLLDISFSKDTFYSIYSWVVYITLLIYSLIFILTVYRREYVDQFKSFYFSNFFTKLITFIVIGFILSGVFGFLTNLLQSLFQLYYTTSSNQEAVVSLGSDVSYIFLFFVTCVYAPIFEEFIYRFILIDKVLFFLKGVIPKVIVSSLIFSFIHSTTEFGQLFTNFNINSILVFIITIMSYLGISLVLSFSYAKERNIYINMLIHFSFNFIAFIGILATSQI